MQQTNYTRHGKIKLLIVTNIDSIMTHCVTIYFDYRIRKKKYGNTIINRNISKYVEICQI